MKMNMKMLETRNWKQVETRGYEERSESLLLPRFTFSDTKSRYLGCAETSRGRNS